jgi:hypothetical protein
MTLKLQKLPGKPAELGMYRLTGDLAELNGPGRRVVRDLEVLNVHGPPDALDGLVPFTDLRRLGLSGIDGMRLEPLTRLTLTTLAISNSRGLDLEPLAGLDGLSQLLLTGLEDCQVPARLALPTSLRYLVLVSDSPGATPRVISALVKAIDWVSLAGLEMLDLYAGGAHAVAPVRADLGLLRHLPNLKRLEMAAGVIHAGAGPSPLEPPFDGLSRRLEWLRIEGEDPDRLQAQLQQYLPSTYPVVYPRPPYPDGDAPIEEREWEILEPDAQVPDAPWQTYGSLADALIGDAFAVEHDGLEIAEAKLKAEDPERFRRLEFDPEANGTGIYARSREDLEWVKRTLGLTSRFAS